MNKLIFHITTLNTDFGLDIDYEENNNIEQTINLNAIEMYNKLLFIFGELKKNYVFLKNPYVLKLNPIMYMSKEIRKKYKMFIDEYSKKNKKLLSLKNNLDKIELGEYFFLSTTKHTAEQIIFINNLLKVYTSEDDDKKRATLFNKLQEDFDNILGKVTKKYFLKAFDSSRKNVGERIKEKRICRFCSNGINTIKKVTFNNKAHVIPEALGNKGLITYEECDECNSKFGKTIEKDLISFFDIFRVFYGVNGKNGIPILKFNDKTQMKHLTKKEVDGIIKKENLGLTKEINENLIVIISQNIHFNDNTKTLHVPLEVDNKIATGNIYKTLCKMVISLVEFNELKYLQRTISWINSEEEKIYTIPKIASTIIHNMYVNTPEIILYIRKNNDINVPHILGEFSFKCFKYVFIVPFSDKDKLTFTKDKEFEHFMKNFNHYTYIKNWVFHEMNSTIPKKFIFNMKMEPTI